MRYNLFLDDERFPYVISQYNNDVSAYHYTKYEPFKTEKWVIVRSYYDFVKEIKKRGLPTRVSFDQDLGDISMPERTGYDCAKWLCNYCLDNDLKFPNYYIHSGNKVGARNIKGYIDNYIKNIENA